MIRGRDVSHFQGTVNWKGRKASEDLSFGMAKCVEGVGFFDTQYVANREACHLAGMPFIAYAYVRPEASSALTQVKYLIAKAGQVEGYCMDLEVSALTQAETNAWMRSYGDDLRALVPNGETTFAYLGGYAANGSGQGSVDHFDRWIYPHYTVNSWPTVYAPRVGGNTTGWPAPPAPHVWQCSDSIGGMDADVSNLTLAQLFSGEDTMTPDDVWNYLLTNAIDGKSTAKAGTFVTQIHKLVTAAADDSAASLAILDGTDTAGLKAFAAALAAALPSSPGGAPSAEQVADAVAAKFSTLLGGTA